MSLKVQRRLASVILKTGQSRIHMDPSRIEDIETAITRQDIRKLVHEDVISARPKMGVSRSRARVRREELKKGRHRGPGSRTGKRTSRLSEKEIWMGRIRSIRRRLKDLRSRRAISLSSYRRLYLLSKGGVFEDASDLTRYIEDHGMRRRR